MFRRVALPAAVLAVLSVAPYSARAITYYNLTSADTSTGSNTSPPATVTNPAGIFYGGTGVENQGIFSNPTNSDIVGTGVIRPFIRIQPPGNVNNCTSGSGTPCTESGYNTDGRVTPKGSAYGDPNASGNEHTPQYDGKDLEGSNWNRTLDLNTIPIVEIGGVKYREFILDINERNNSGSEADKYLSLDKFKLYLSSDRTLDNFFPGDNSDSPGGSDPNAYNFYAQSDVSRTTPLATKIYDIDGYVVNEAGKENDGNSSIGLNYDLNSGSGNGIDLVARIPDKFFADVTGLDSTKQFLYLYTSFGEVGTNHNPDVDGPCPTQKVKGVTGPATTSCTNKLPTGDFGQSAGFEEWSTKYQPAPIPGTLLLLTLGAGMLGLIHRRAPQRAA